MTKKDEEKGALARIVLYGGDVAARGYSPGHNHQQNPEFSRANPFYPAESEVPGGRAQAIDNTRAQENQTMGCMLSEVYDALRLAGVPDGAAKSAAEAVFTANMALRQEINQTVKEVGDKTDQAVKEVGDKTDQAVKELGDRIDKVDQKLGDRIDKVVDRIISLEQGQAVHKWMLTSLCGMMITLLIKTFWPS